MPHGNTEQANLHGLFLKEEISHPTFYPFFGDSDTPFAIGF
jgi:hypothetical protein